MNARDQRYGLAQRRAATLLSTLDLLGQGRGRPVAAEGIRAEDIRAAALMPLSPVAVKAVANLAAQALANLDAITAILAGLCPEDLATFLANVPGWRVERAKNPEQLRAQTRAVRAQRKAMVAATPDMSPASRPTFPSPRPLPPRTPRDPRRRGLDRPHRPHG